MKIGFLTPEFPHVKTGNAGGIGTSILNLSKGLTALGHEVSLLVYGQDRDEIFTENGITFYKIKNVKLKGLSLLLTQIKVRKLIDQLHADHKIDLVEAPDWTGFTCFLKPKCPLVLRLHGSDTYFCDLEQRPVKWLNRFFEKRAFQQADGIISVSRFTAEQTNKVFGTNRSFTVIPNGIDTDNFQPTAQTTSNTILYFGTLIRKKGLLELPLIFNAVVGKNPSAKLVLIGKDSKDRFSGTDSTWELMQPLFSQAAFQNVHYRGSVAYAEMKEHIAKASVCVFPTFAEALPVSWLEAMAAGKSIIASDIGWAAEIVEDGKDGFLAHPKNHELFAEKILELLASDTLRASTGIAARDKILQKFSNLVVAQQSVDCYQQLLE